MQLTIFIVDAFTTQQFKGNSAGVVPVNDWPVQAVMQNIARENNLSETAFVKPLADNKYAIRWFSPITEIDFCGHATLASAYVLFNELGITSPVEFVTAQVGNLQVVAKPGGSIAMTFPSQPPTPVTQVPNALLAGLSIRPVQVLSNRQAYFALLSCEQDVYDIQADSAQLKELAPLDVVVTAPSRQYDFVSRYFWPANGGDEDPVTGSIHAGLAPYWGLRLNKTHLRAYQASQRGGELDCVLVGQQVVVSGQCVLYLKGTVYLQ